MAQFSRLHASAMVMFPDSACTCLCHFESISLPSDSIEQKAKNSTALAIVFQVILMSS